MIRTLMALGDSITWGYMSSNGTGYLSELNKDLTAAGITANFVGSQFDGTFHDEGHPGWQINDIANNVNGWLASANPDVITLMIGTNDVDSYDSNSTPLGPDGAPARLEALIDKITADDPHAELFVATIPPDAYNGYFPVDAYNDGVKSVVAAEQAAGKHVHLVDVNAQMSTADLSPDGIHPNDAGYTIIGDAFASSIESVLLSGSGGSSPPSGGSALTPSADGTIVAGADGSIVTAAGNSFAINSSGSITENGNALAETHGVTELAYVGGTLYQEATSGHLWFSLNEATGQWSQTSDPLQASGSSTPPAADPPDPPAAASPDGTVVTGGNGSIVTASGNSFAINSSGAITENGSALAETHGVTELAYVGGTLYQEATSSHLWFSLNEATGQWTETANPLTASGTSDPPASSASAGSAFNANDPAASGMVLTFDDEFNSNDISNTGVSSGAQWANHLWYEGANPGAVSVANGVLSLAPNGDLSTVNSSGQGFAQTYGYFEIDMKVPAGVGTWPAFWMMSQQHVVNGSAPAAEIDAIEGQGNKPYGYYTTLHYNTGGGGSAGPDQFNPMPNYTGDVSSTPMSDGYHRYGVLWSPDSNTITYYFDGKPVSSSTVYSTTNSSPVMVLIDNWLGDIGWGGNSPTGQNYGPLNIDYVRVYQFASQNPTAVVAQTVSPASGQTDPTALASADGTGVSTAGSGSGSTTPPNDPPPTDPPPSNTAGPESANDTVVTDTSHSITTAAGNVFGIDATGHVMLNGVAMAETHGVTELAYVGHTLYQEATASNLWFSYNDATHSWSAPTASPLPASDPPPNDPPPNDPPPTSPTESVNDTVVTDASHGITTAAGNVFGIDATGHVTLNGVAMAETHGVTELAYVGHTLYQEATSSNLWFSYNEATHSWSAPTSDPLPAGSSTPPVDPPTTSPTETANDTVVTDASHSITTAAGNVFGIDASGHVTLNGVALPETHQVTELAYVGHTLYQEATAANLWFSYNEASHSWSAPTSSPLAADGSGTPPTSTVHAMAPMLTVFEASGNENSAIPLYIQASQASSSLADQNLTVTVSNLGGATLNHGSAGSNGSWTLHTADLSGLTVTPAGNFTGMLSLSVSATDSEAGSSATSVAETLDVAVNPAAQTAETLLDPSFTDGAHHLYAVASMPTSDLHIASFDPTNDILDLAPLLNKVAEHGTTPVVTLEAGANGGTAVAVDPTGTDPHHGSVVVTLDHVLPQSLPAAAVWH